MAEQGSFDPQTEAGAKQRIRQLVRDVGDLARSCRSADDFFPDILPRVVSALGVAGAAVWLVEPGSEPRLEYHADMARTGLLASDEKLASCVSRHLALFCASSRHFSHSALGLGGRSRDFSRLAALP